jgi:acetolactate synthase I/II/III large subunit
MAVIVSARTSEEAETEAIQSFSETAEAVLALYAAHGVDYIFINPGTDTFPLQEAYARRMELGLPCPQAVMCIHEHVAVSAAHGYYLATGRPQVVQVHVDLGTINAGGAMHNAQRANVGIVFTAGRVPYASKNGVPGAMDSGIFYYQEQLDQAGIVRNFTKWQYELTRPESVSFALERAFQLAANEPAGPVYLTYPRDIMMLPANDVRFPVARRTNKSVQPAIPEAIVRDVAELLANAERPVIVAGRNGRDPDSLRPLAALADVIGAAVVDSHDYMNMPADHPLRLPPGASAHVFSGNALSQADVLLFVDTDLLYLPSQTQLAPGAIVIQIDRDPMKEDHVFWNYPIDMRLTARPAFALRQLHEAVSESMTASQRDRAAERRTSIGEQVQRDRHAAVERAKGKSSTRPLDGEWVVWNLKQVLPQQTIILDESMSNRVWARTHLSTGGPGTYFSSGGASLGWAPGAAIGMKLARPDHFVVALCGDGVFNFSSPVAALWGQRKASAPSLTLVFNNACYSASRVPLRGLYPNGAAVRTANYMATDIQPPPDYAKLAESCGALGVTLRDPDEVEAGLHAAVEAVKGGRSAVVDVVLAPTS